MQDPQGTDQVCLYQSWMDAISTNESEKKMPFDKLKAKEDGRRCLFSNQAYFNWPT